MIEISDIETLKDAIETFGKEKQIDMAIEEMSELIKALLKDRRAQYNLVGWDYERVTQNVIEEMADVYIMLEQLTIIYDRPNTMQFVANAKVARLAKRIEEANQCT